eukprot:snap_masked-scaffold_90-processed-gene-0.32-mRNA-1 protein AED:1.00 eAED:1.00 QI:0/-1/0/0/-1/1/1/0/304
MKIGHLSHEKLENLQNVTPNKLEVRNHTENHFCKRCICQKLDSSAIPTRSRNLFVTKFAGEKVHVGTIGPIKPMSIHKFTYAVILTDSFPKFRWVILVKKKSKIPKKLELKFIQIQQRWKFNTFIFHSDEGTEFTNNLLKQYFIQSGISHHTSNVGTPQKNGLAEVTNKIVFNGVRAMLHTAKLSHNFWEYALRYHLKQLNSYPIKHPLEPNIMTIPHELLTGFKPDITMFRISGTIGLGKRPLTKRSNLDSKAEPCQLLGITKKPCFIVRWLKDNILGETRTAKFNGQDIVSEKNNNTAKTVQ